MERAVGRRTFKEMLTDVFGETSSTQPAMRLRMPLDPSKSTLASCGPLRPYFVIGFEGVSGPVSGTRTPRKLELRPSITK